MERLTVVCYLLALDVDVIGTDTQYTATFMKPSERAVVQVMLRLVL